LINAAREIHHDDDPEFGYRFITDELAGHGVTASRKPGKPAQYPASAVVGALASAGHRPQARPAGPRRLGDPQLRRRRTERVWLTDITDHPTAEGKLYLCAIKDAWTKPTVGASRWTPG
jgi:transposase InsO family protein